MAEKQKFISSILIGVAGLALGAGVVLVVVIRDISPNFGLYQKRSLEIQTYNNLQQIRSGLMEYKVESDEFPTDLSKTFADSRLFQGASGLFVQTKDHAASGQIHNVSSLQADDRGGWGYVNNPKDKDFGHVFVNCTHVNYKGVPWWKQ